MSAEGPARGNTGFVGPRGGGGCGGSWGSGLCGRRVAGAPSSPLRAPRLFEAQGPGAPVLPRQPGRGGVGARQWTSVAERPPPVPEGHRGDHVIEGLGRPAGPGERDRAFGEEPVHQLLLRPRLQTSPLPPPVSAAGAPPGKS